MRHPLILRVAASLAALAAMLFPFAPAAAGQSFKVCGANGLCGRAQPVDEAQMADVAGRYTIAGEIVGMNLLMASSWQAANGQKLEGKATLSIALPRSGHAHASLDTQATATEPQSAAPSANGAGNASTGAGLQGVDGVSQVIQIAGDGNGAANRAQIDVSAAPSSGAVTGNGRSAASYTASNGAQATAAIDGNRIALQLKMPGAGVVQQQFNASGLGNIQQLIQLAADRQQVMNQLQLQLQVQAPTRTALAAAGLGQALDMLRGK